MDRVETVRATRGEETHEEFERRVRAQADRLRTAFDEGKFDGGYRIGLELEGYGVDREGRLARVPDEVFETEVERELGAHNAELNTPATGFYDFGLTEQVAAVAKRVGAARVAFAEADPDLRFIPDGMWTIGPEEGALEYLTAVEAVDDLQFPANMANEPRYFALDADIVASGTVELSVPGCRRTFPTILVESLSTSMQVHLQTPTGAFVDHFRAALRTAGPVVALAANSPFLPPDLYEEGADPREVVGSMAELRIPVFESMNVGDPGKVRFPEDLSNPADAVDLVIDDRRCAPYLREWAEDGEREGFEAEHWEFLHKQGTCWRWVRPILGPEGPRIEYRVPAAQPSVPDVISVQSLVLGLVHGVAAADHPLLDLPWEAARDSLYAAAEDGLDADLAWITADGERVEDAAAVYPDLFDVARQGLSARNVPGGRIDELLAPVERRWEARTTPSSWKRDRARERLAGGADLREAIEETQRDYFERCGEETALVEW